MDMSGLAVKMLEWEQAQKHADALKAEIEAAVLALGKTQTVGNVRASYSKGRKSYDYRAALEGYDDVELLPWTEEVPATVKIDYRAACKGLGIEDVPYTEGAPSVSLKVLA